MEGRLGRRDDDRYEHPEGGEAGGGDGEGADPLESGAAGEQGHGGILLAGGGGGYGGGGGGERRGGGGGGEGSGGGGFGGPRRPRQFG